MSGISAKGVKKTSYVSKSIQPGVVEAKIIGLAVTKVDNPRDPKVPEYKVTLKLLTKKPEPDFEGWDIDPQDPSKGKYQGQFGQVSTSNWNYKTFTFNNKKTGRDKTVTYEEQIVGLFQEIAEGFGLPDLLTQEVYQNGFPTWSAFINKLATDCKFKSTYVHFLIGGTKTKNSKGSTVTYLNLADRKLIDYKKRIALEAADLAPYDEATMVYVNQKAFVQVPNEVSEEEADVEFNNNDVEFGNADMGTDDTELFNNVENFDDDDFSMGEEPGF